MVSWDYIMKALYICIPLKLCKVVLWLDGEKKC